MTRPAGVIVTAVSRPYERRKLEKLQRVALAWVAAGRPTPTPPYSGDDEEEQ